MYLLFLFVHLFFSFLLYTTGSIVWWIVFIVLWIASFFFFSPFSFFHSKKQEDSNQRPEVSVSNKLRKKLSRGIVDFFKNYIFISALVLLYLSIFWMIYGLSDILFFSVQEFITITSCCYAAVYCILRFFHGKSERLYGFLEINLLIFTLFSLVSSGVNFPLSGFLESLSYGFLGVAWLYRLWSNETLSKARLHLSALLTWILFYVWILTTIFLLFPNPTLLMIVGVTSIYSISSFEIVEFQGLQRSRQFVRILWLFLSYISICILGFLSFQEESIMVIPLLLLMLFFQVYVHRRYENYPSLLFSTLIPVWIYLFFFTQPTSFFFFLVFSWALTLILTFFGRMVRTGYPYDEYVFQTVATISMIVSTIVYWYRVWFHSILEFSWVLLLFSVLFFVSYLQIRK